MGIFLRSLFAAVLVAFALSQAAVAREDTRVSVKEREDLASVIEDEGQRKQLVSRIRALIAVAKDAAPPVQSPGARIISGLSEKAREAGRQVIAATETLLSSSLWSSSSSSSPRFSASAAVASVEFPSTTMMSTCSQSRSRGMTSMVGPMDLPSLSVGMMTVRVRIGRWMAAPF